MPPQFHSVKFDPWNGKMGLIPVTRTYRQRDLDNPPFGIGTFHNYHLYLWADTNQNYQQADLILPDGGRINDPGPVPPGMEGACVWKRNGWRSWYLSCGA